MVLYLSKFVAIIKAKVSDHTLEKLKEKQIIFRTDTAERNVTKRDEIRIKQTASESKFVQRKWGGSLTN